MQIEWRGLESLVPYAKNARTHSDEQIAQIAASMVEFGFTNPVLIDADGGIVAGHGRVLAARQVMGGGGSIPRCPAGSVPCLCLGDLTADQRRAYVLADNKIALNAGWDFDRLREELHELDAVNFDLGITGFAPGEIEQIMCWTPPNTGLTDPDEVPEVPSAPASVLGDVWVLGRHRLVCGDATSSADVERALNNVAPRLMVTDPPYGVEYDASWRNDAVQAGNGARGAPSGRAVGKVENDDRADWRDAWALFPGDVAYVWHAGIHAGAVADSLAGSDSEIRAQIIWAKQQFAISRGHYHWQHEPCWYAVRKGATGHWSGDRKQTTLWQIDKPVKSETGHSTQKPVECMRRPIENNSSAGQAVYEPFSGSGTTIIAAEMTGRACHAIELNPAYVDVAVKRWQDFTGKAAVFEADGRDFNEVAAGRGAKTDHERPKAEADVPQARHRKPRKTAA